MLKVYSLATLTLFVFYEYVVFKWRLLDSEWTRVATTKKRMDGSAIIWFDDFETKVWILGGRHEHFKSNSCNCKFQSMKLNDAAF